VTRVLVTRAARIGRAKAGGRETPVFPDRSGSPARAQAAYRPRPADGANASVQLGNALVAKTQLGAESA